MQGSQAATASAKRSAASFMGGASSKGGAPAPTGGRPATAAAPEKPRGEPLVQQKFDRWYADQKSDPGFGADEEENQDGDARC